MPQTTISIPFNRVVGISAPALTGTAMAMHTWNDLVTSGYITSPFSIPLDCDVSRPINVLVPQRPVVGGVGGAFTVELQLEATRVSPGLVGANVPVLFNWPTPPLWANSDLQQVLMDDGTGVSFPGGTFLPTDLVGLLIRRIGAGPNDTYPGVILVADCLLFAYYKRCQNCCC
jgi:hypothetical protein